MHRSLLAVLAAVILLANCASPVAPAACKQQAAQFLKDADALTTEWTDAVKLASSTSKISLAPQVAQLQALRRKLTDLQVPQCALVYRDSLAAHMDATIEMFLAFMRGESSASDDLLILATGRFDEADMIRTAIEGGAGGPEAAVVARATLSVRKTAAIEAAAVVSARATTEALAMEATVAAINAKNRGDVKATQTVVVEQDQVDVAEPRQVLDRFLQALQKRDCDTMWSLSTPWVQKGFEGNKCLWFAQYDQLIEPTMITLRSKSGNRVQFNALGRWMCQPPDCQKPMEMYRSWNFDLEWDGSSWRIGGATVG